MRINKSFQKLPLCIHLLLFLLHTESVLFLQDPLKSIPSGGMTSVSEYTQLLEPVALNWQASKVEM